jgi:hypothetical protein
MAAPRPPVYAEPDVLVVQNDLVVTPDPPVVTPDAPPVLLEHRLEIVESGAFAHAVCSGCSWTGPARRSRAVAAADAKKHPQPTGD